MKITQLKTYIANNPGRGYVFVKIETDGGIHGWGEGTLEAKERAVVAAITDLSGHIVGQDPTRVEYLWQIIRRHGFWRGGVVTNTALSAIDQALWDITGKAFGQPVYRLLGGACRDRVRCYCHGSAQNAKAALDNGWQAIKTGAGGYHEGRFLEERVIPDTLRNLEMMREILGDSFDIMIDCHGRFRPSLAVRLIRAIEPFRLFFVEEPVPPDNKDAFKKIAQARPSVDIATGERLFTRWGFRELVEKQYVDVIQPDVCHCGGISELRKIASLAETYHVTVAPHNPNGPLATAASAHVAAAIPNFSILETHVVQPLWDNFVSGGWFKPVKGFIQLPEAPGLGVEVDEERLKREPPFEARGYGALFDRDGAPADL